jgi:hypothetical protein
MTAAAYTTLAQVRRRLAGDAVVTAGTWDAAIVDAIAQASDMLDQEIAQARGQRLGWSLLAASDHAVQLVSISPDGAATAGTFTLTSGSATTSAIAHDAAAADVEAALAAALGPGSVAVSGAPGGPWTVTFAGTGPQDVLAPSSSLTPATAHAVVEQLVPGAAATVTRRYSSRGTALLPIDDCTAVSAVRLTDSSGATVQALAAGTDYLAWPLDGLPIEGLRLVRGCWPTTPGGIAVDMTPGFATAIPANLERVAAMEVIRSLRSAQVGDDDRLGVTQYGSVVVSKALLSTTLRAIDKMRAGASLLRGAARW